MKIRLTTPTGQKFWAESFAGTPSGPKALGGFSAEQRQYIMSQVSTNALNEAYAGRAKFEPEGLRTFNEVFPEGWQVPL